MNKKPLVVSFYTEGSLYEKEAENLIKSCKKFNLDYDVVSVPNKGSWSANCCFKPEFLLKKLEEHNRPLIWMDADSIFNKNPVFFNDCNADVALRINDNVPVDDKTKILTRTIFLNATLSTKKLLQFWKKECERCLALNKIVFDQVCLRKVVLHYPTIVEIKRLPISYIYTIDNPNDRENIDEEAVIVHYQVSRLHKNTIDEEATLTSSRKTS